MMGESHQPGGITSFVMTPAGKPAGEKDKHEAEKPVPPAPLFVAR